MMILGASMVVVSAFMKINHMDHSSLFMFFGITIGEIGLLSEISAIKKENKKLKAAIVELRNDGSK